MKKCVLMAAFAAVLLLVTSASAQLSGMSIVKGEKVGWDESEY